MNRTSANLEVLYYIDIDIPEECFGKIKPLLNAFIIFDPQQFENDCWKIFLMTLDYHGQKIDLGGAYNSKIFNK